MKFIPIIAAQFCPSYLPGADKHTRAPTAHVVSGESDMQSQRRYCSNAIGLAFLTKVESVWELRLILKERGMQNCCMSTPSKPNVLLKYMDVKEMMLEFVGDTPVVSSLHQNPKANRRYICLMVAPLANITSHGP